MHAHNGSSQKNLFMASLLASKTAALSAMLLNDFIQQDYR